MKTRNNGSGFAPTGILQGALRERAPARICLVDDEDEVRQLFGRLIERWEELELCGAYRCAEAALAAIPVVKPAVVLMDIRMPRLSGLEGTRELRLAWPELKIIVVTGVADQSNLQAAFRAGANAFLSKPVPAEQLREAIGVVLEGGIYASPRVAQFLFDQLRSERERPEGRPCLTPREHDVMRCLCRGLLYKEIAAELGITEATVRHHLHNIYEKFGVANKIEAVNEFGKQSRGGDCVV